MSDVSANHPFPDCTCPDRHRIEGRCVLHAPTAGEIADAVMTDINIAADAACVKWNNSVEAETLGIYVAYETQPLMSLVIVPRDAPESDDKRYFVSHMVSEERTLPPLTPEEATDVP